MSNKPSTITDSSSRWPRKPTRREAIVATSAALLALFACYQEAFNDRVQAAVAIEEAAPPPKTKSPGHRVVTHTAPPEEPPEPEEEKEEATPKRTMSYADPVTEVLAQMNECESVDWSCQENPNAWMARPIGYVPPYVYLYYFPFKDYARPIECSMNDFGGFNTFVEVNDWTSDIDIWHGEGDRPISFMSSFPPYAWMSDVCDRMAAYEDGLNESADSGLDATDELLYEDEAFDEVDSDWAEENGYYCYELYIPEEEVDTGWALTDGTYEDAEGFPINSDGYYLDENGELLW
ncbi:MAG: hypothetical protein Q8P27_00595, partial [Candidatus Peregrinibacteria bacterium]|nr:hypothetical protein [Candidatus Peregrinibacteria bacterium]